MASVWFPPRETSRSWNAAFATPEASGSSIDCSSLSISCQLGDSTATTALGRDQPGGERLDEGARFEHVGERHVARLQDE